MPDPGLISPRRCRAWVPDALRRRARQWGGLDHGREASLAQGKECDPRECGPKGNEAMDTPPGFRVDVQLADERPMADPAQRHCMHKESSAFMQKYFRRTRQTVGPEPKPRTFCSECRGPLPRRCYARAECRQWHRPLPQAAASWCQAPGAAFAFAFCRTTCRSTALRLRQNSTRTLALSGHRAGAAANDAASVGVLGVCLFPHSCTCWYSKQGDEKAQALSWRSVKIITAKDMVGPPEKLGIIFPSRPALCLAGCARPRQTRQMDRRGNAYPR